jgi:hypothetical protein
MRKGRHREAYTMCKVSLWIRESDWPWLHQRYGSHGASKVIRELIVAHRRKIEELEAPRAARGFERIDLEGL